MKHDERAVSITSDTHSPIGWPVLIVCMLITALVPGCIEEPVDREYVQYSVAITADGPFVVALPMPDCTPVLDRLRVKGGKGEFYLTNTSHGTCIKVSGDSFIEIRAQWYPEIPDERFLMTINLTTMDLNVTEPYGWWPLTVDIPDMNISIQWIEGTNVKLSLFSWMLFHHLTYTFFFTTISHPLGPGWNEVVAEGSGEESHAP